MPRSKMTRRAGIATAIGMAFGLLSGTASELTISTINSTTGIENTLTNALLSPGGGVSIVPGSVTYQGTNTATLQQSGTYSGFNLAPSSGSTPTLTLGNGIFLTSGNANIPLTNTINNFSSETGSGSNALLSTLSGTNTNDANVLSFNFNVAAGQTSVSAQFVFGTDEFPTQDITDIFGFFVDGTNFAKFGNGNLISNTPGNPTNFIDNRVDNSRYAIEYNGLTQVFTVTGILGTPNAGGSHTLTIGIADTDDTIFDSGVFVTSLTAGSATGGGGIVDTPPPPVGAIPEPETYALMLVGLAVLGGVAKRRGQRGRRSC